MYQIANISKQRVDETICFVGDSWIDEDSKWDILHFRSKSVRSRE